jgi:LAO/AO transport system kinase
MKTLSQHPSAFVRPSPSGSTLGGVGYKTRECILLCEAAGYDTVIVETVGVGQAETMVHAMTDFFLLLMVPGTGDELQGIKRGIIEMADLIAINKADGPGKQPAQEAKNTYEQVLHLFQNTKKGWVPKAITCSAVKEEGIDEIWTLIRQYQTITQQNGYFDQQRKEQNLYWMHEIIQQLLKDHFYQHPKIREALPAIEEQVVAGKTSALHAAQTLMELKRDLANFSNWQGK